MSSAIAHNQADLALATLCALYDCAPFIMGVVELRGNDVIILNANAATAASYGRAPDEIVGASARALGTPDDVMAQWIAAYRRSRKLAQAVHFEIDRSTPEFALILSAVVRPLDLDATPGAPERFAYIAHDVTEARHAADALAASEERLKYALDIADEAIWDWDITSNTIWLSPKGYDQLGYVLGAGGTRERWFTLVHPDDRPAAEALMDAHLAGTIPLYSIEHRVRHNDGSYIWLQSRGKVVKRDAHGFPLRMIGTQLVITDRKRAEAELRQANEAAQAASAAKSAFLANVSHEIRTPLTAILGYADLLQDRALTSDERYRFAETIRRSGRHLLTLINDLLDFSKIEADKIRVETIPCDPANIVFEVTTLMQPRAEARGLAYTVRQIPPLPRVLHTDPTRARQVIINLLDNAIKFTEKGGVELTLRFSSDDEHDPAGRFYFEISDTGIGIAADVIPRLFTPFEQADASTTRRFGGTGLGLSISHRLAHLLGGGIDVSSTLRQGSRFSFWIPAVTQLPASQRPAPDQPAGAPAEPHAVSEAGARILLVEDSPDIQTLIRHLLDRRGVKLDIASNGAQALTLVHANGQPACSYDLILMDVQMPTMDGYTATRHLRAAGVTTPIIAITADAGPARREECQAAGCTDLFPKPIEVDALLTTLRKYLGR